MRVSVLVAALIIAALCLCDVTVAKRNQRGGRKLSDDEINNMFEGGSINNEPSGMPDAKSETKEEGAGGKEHAQGQPDAAQNAPDNAPGLNRPYTYYELLGIPQDFDQDALKRGYRAKALASHPDKVRDPEEKEKAVRAFIRIANAFKTLSHAETKRRYDWLLTRNVYDYDHAKWISELRKEQGYNDDATMSEKVWEKYFDDEFDEFTTAEEAFETTFRDELVAPNIILGLVTLAGCFVSLPAAMWWYRYTKRSRQIKALKSDLNVKKSQEDEATFRARRREENMRRQAEQRAKQSATDGVQIEGASQSTTTSTTNSAKAKTN